MDDNVSVYFLHVKFWRELNGIVPIAAQSPEEAKEILIKELTDARDLEILEVSTEPPVGYPFGQPEEMPTEDDAPKTVN